MFLSVIVPIYNPGEHLRACLDSLLQQDLPGDLYEIICVDDGSTDNSPEILREYSGMAPNLRVIRQENEGVVSARNTGMKLAAGEYIWLVDADDFVKENCMSFLYEKVKAENCDRLIFGAYQFQDMLTPEEQDSLARGTLPVNAPWYDAVVWRCLLRKNFLKRNRLFFRYPELTHGEDGLFMYEVCASKPKEAVVDEVLYLYRVHEGSAETKTDTAHRRKKIRSFVRIAEILEKYRKSGRKDPGTANLLMTFLWMALYETAGLPAIQRKEVVKEIRGKGLFPYCRPAECTLHCSFMTERTDWVGKGFDYGYRHLHRLWGFWLFCVLKDTVRLFGGK